MKGQGKPARRKGGDSVSMKPAGNVKSGCYSMANDGKSLESYCGSFGRSSKVAGSHRKTRSVQPVRDNHRSK